MILSIWISATFILIVLLAIKLHKTEMKPQQRTAGFLGITAAWLILSAVILSIINFYIKI